MVGMEKAGLSAELVSGAVIAGQFRLQRKLGAGGMGELFLAEQIEVQRTVAIKVVHAHLARQHPELVERFKREARAIAQLSHPHVVQLHTYGQTDQGQPFFAMEYVPGRTLAAELSAGRMSAEPALRLARQVASALAEAHRQGVVHRDLKPDNIMLTQVGEDADFVKVVDFGIAKVLAPTDEKLTRTGAVFGTPQYMAPEQVSSKHVDARTDVYALGVVLYEMLTGAAPFVAEAPFDVLSMQVHSAAPPPSTKVPGLSPDVDALVLGCLEKAPDDRLASAEAVIHAIDGALAAGVDGSPGTETQPLPAEARATAATQTLSDTDAAFEEPATDPAPQTSVSSTSIASDAASLGWGWRLFVGLVAGFGAYFTLVSLDLGLPPIVVYAASVLLALLGAWLGPAVVELLGAGF